MNFYITDYEYRASDFKQFFYLYINVEIILKKNRSMCPICKVDAAYYGHFELWQFGMVRVLSAEIRMHESWST